MLIKYLIINHKCYYITYMLQKICTGIIHRYQQEVYLALLSTFCYANQYPKENLTYPTLDTSFC